MYISFLCEYYQRCRKYHCVYVLKAELQGVAYPSLISRVFSAIIITVLCSLIKNWKLTCDSKDIFKFDGKDAQTYFNITIPNGVENGIFQLVKVALSSIHGDVWNLSNCS